MSLIEVKNLEKIYANEGVKTPALRGATFSIEKGEFVGIMGPSGSGKSTLLHILGFLDEPTRGEYRFDGRIMDEYSNNEKAKIRNKKMGFIFQSFNLLPKTSVLENVKLPLLYSDIKKSKWNLLAKNAIESVGLSHRIAHEPSQLSGGEKQRVAIARALVNRPDVLLGDEPTGNLDSVNTGEIVKLLKKINQLGTTVILATHDKQVINTLDKRVIVLDQGEIVSDNAKGTYQA